MSMSQDWAFHNPVQVTFGRGCRKSVFNLPTGGQFLIVSSAQGRRRWEHDEILCKFSTNRSVRWADCVASNPDIDALDGIVAATKDANFDAIIAFGGGSAMDAAKAVSVANAPELNGAYGLRDLISQPGTFASVHPRPLIMLPTTAGTGSEVTPFATVWDHTNRRKLSLAGDTVFPQQALVDPALMDNLPVSITSDTGLDAINQAAESIWNKRASPLTLKFASRALALGLDSLPQLLADPHQPDKRDELAECSLLAGLAISQTRTALCHSISYPITAHFGIPHGIACAFSMLAVFRLNQGYAPHRFLEMAQAAGFADAEALYQALEVLLKSAGVSAQVQKQVGRLSSLTDLADEMFTPGRADNNLAPVDSPVIEQLLHASWS